MSNKLQEIFKDKPELLQEDCVKKLIEYVSEQHARNINISKKHTSFYHNVMDVILNSELVLIGGDNHKIALEKIEKLTENF